MTSSARFPPVSFIFVAFIYELVDGALPYGRLNTICRCSRRFQIGLLVRSRTEHRSCIE